MNGPLCWTLAAGSESEVEGGCHSVLPSELNCAAMRPSGQEHKALEVIGHSALSVTSNRFNHFASICFSSGATVERWA